MFQQLKNLRLAAATVAEHLSDDPALLALQIAQRLPNAFRHELGSLAVNFFPSTSTSPVPAMGSLVRGDIGDVERRIRLASWIGVGANRSRLLADIALVAGRTDLVDLLAPLAAGASRFAALAARRKWFDGDMTGAVDVLKFAPVPTGQLQRLKSELEVFQGYCPALARHPFVPRSNTVLHVLTNSLPHTGSGYAQRTHSMLLSHAAAGWSVEAVTRLGYPVQVGKILASDRDLVDGIPYHRLVPGVLRGGMKNRLQQQAELTLRLALKVRPSVLHTTTPFSNALVTAAVAEAIGVPWVYEVRGQLADTWAATRGDEAVDSERYRLFREREAEAMDRADLVVTLGEQMRQSIVQQGTDPRKLILCPNGVGGVFLEEPGSPASARAQLGLPAEGQWIGTVSSLVDYEGLGTLLESAALLSPQHPELRVLIVGDGVAGASLRQRAMDLGLGERAMFTGRVSRAQAHLYHQALDVFVVPRKDQQVTRHVTPLKPVEAMASSRPVVASRLPALAEIVKDGRTGLLAEPENAADLAAKLDRLLLSSELRMQMGKAGRREALRNRTWKANAHSLASAYDQLTEERV
ncbi:glycosyltransferase family 4 protein [Arthrobacter globiformis]|uniref:glycosyltransferase family 4 protein n=1 Tax=Arthrobacter globiformis TaxID=1665 RepID=UPI0027807200|nr:glycosyltransferase family 4 protein [Arthrobacter globiformis]MDQ0865779.1 glycosyltransferase involved in cell wall biosynthesis [Arthrobacter globiformis]